MNLDHLARRAARDVAAALAHPSAPVAAVPAADYQPPSYLPDIVSADAVAELVRILDATRRVSEQHVGEDTDAVYERGNGDPAIVALQDALVAWIDGFVATRLAKPHPKDRGDSVRRFQRIERDLAPWLYPLGSAGANALVLGRAVRYFPWRLYRDTWAPLIRIARAWASQVVDWKGLAPEHRPVCAQLIARGGWGSVREPRLVCEAMGGIAPDGDRAADIRPRLAALAADVAAMRPRLVRGFDSAATAVEVTPGVWAAWVWAQAHLLGVMVVARGRDELLELVAHGRSQVSVAFGMDGRMAVPALPWLTVDAEPDLAGAWAANLRLLDAAHARLRAASDAVDARPERLSG